MVELTIRDCEVTVLVVTWILTIANVIMAFRYLKELYKNMQEWKYIQWDKHHSHQHFAIAWIMAIISIMMFINSFSTKAVSETFVEHLFYNLLCIFVLYPHLFSEK